MTFDVETLEDAAGIYRCYLRGSCHQLYIHLDYVDGSFFIANDRRSLRLVELFPSGTLILREDWAYDA